MKERVSYIEKLNDNTPIRLTLLITLTREILNPSIVQHKVARNESTDFSCLDPDNLALLSEHLVFWCWCWSQTHKHAHAKIYIYTQKTRVREEEEENEPLQFLYPYTYGGKCLHI